MKKNVAFLILIATLLTACAGTITLNGTTWELVSYGPVDNPTMALPDVDATISFDDDDNLKGNVGCNGFFGEYEVSGNTISTGPLASTMMACETPQMDQEYAVLMLLNGTLDFESDGATLTIFSEDGTSALHLTRITE